jgi:oxygen-independent coproporphyrinogen-3 oxidase
MAALAAIGFNRASFGVQDFDPVVQAAVNRVQSVEETLAVMQAARAAGFRSLNIDLIYGLPKQTVQGFARTLDTVIAARPDRLAIYSYAHLPALFKPQKRIHAEDLPSSEEKLGLLALAIEKMQAAGYRYIGMDHFALPEDELARAQDAGQLHRNFMGYTTHAQSDLVGFGASAISHIGASFSQNQRELRDYLAVVETGELALARGIALNDDDVLRADVIQQLMCQGEVDMAAVERGYGIRFADYFADALARLAALERDGLVTVDAGHIRATAQGRLLLRHVAMCFDAYLHRQEEQPVRFSKAI